MYPTRVASGVVKARDVAAGAVIVGGAIGVAYLVTANASGSPPPPPPPTCPASDVLPVNGACPPGFEPDPYAPGCCMPTPVGIAGTHLTLTNAANPFKGILTAPTPGMWAPHHIGTLMSPAGLSQPPPGYLWVVRSASVTVSLGTAAGMRSAKLWIYPFDPATPGGDGPIIATAGGSTPSSTSTGVGAPGVGTSTPASQVWACALPFTPSMVLNLQENLLVGDTAVFTLEVDQYELSSEQEEVLLGFGGPFAGYPTTPGSLQISAAGTFAGENAPITPPKGYIWVPIAAEINLAESSTSGVRHAELFLNDKTPPTEANAAVVAETGNLDTPGVANNNTTGSYTPRSSEGTSQGVKAHLTWKPGILFVDDLQVVYVGYESQSGDMVKFRGVFLQQKAGQPLPWNYPPAA